MSDENKRQYFEHVTTKTPLSRIPRITQTSTRYNMDTGVPVSAGRRERPLRLLMVCLKTTFTGRILPAGLNLHTNLYKSYTAKKQDARLMLSDCVQKIEKNVGDTL